MASFSTVTAGVSTVSATDINQFADALSGLGNYPVSLTGVNDAINWGLSVRNQDATNGRTARLLDSSGRVRLSLDGNGPRADPDGTGLAVMVTTSHTQTLTNKTLTGPVVSTPIVTTTARTYAPAASGTATLDLSLGSVHEITMPAGNITIAVSNVPSQRMFFQVDITQDNVGSRTVTWFTTIRWAGGAPTLTTTANKRDSFVLKVTSTNTFDGYAVGQVI